MILKWQFFLGLSVLLMCDATGQSRGQSEIWLTWNHSSFSVDKLRDVLQLPTSSGFRLLKIEKDNLEMEHRYLQQYHLGIPVLGAQVIVHIKDNQAFLINGNICLDIKIDNSIDYATAYTQDKLAIIGPNIINEPGYHLAITEFNSNTAEVEYKDVSTGETILVLNHQKRIFENGVANTRFSGEVDIVTEKVDGQFRLREERRGVKIITLNARNIPVDSLMDNFQLLMEENLLSDFYDDDNYWDNANEHLDELATDIHWGTEVTFDYYLDQHDRLGLDGIGGDMLNIVHIGDDWDEAFYLPPPYNFMGYGDGGLLATLDVVAHEVTHGIVRFTAGLLYIGESAILDESFADIFSAAVKFHTDLPALKNKWELAEQLGTFRSLQDPKAFNQPDTYKGEHWYTGDLRSFYAHQNNGVPNYWFYLLTEGGDGINDNGFSYSSQGIGLLDAEKIAYRTLTSYLTNLSSFNDFRMGSLQAAEDLFGKNSFQMQEVEAAWKAVGVLGLVADAEPAIASNSLTIYPNPTPGAVKFKIPGDSQEAEITCYDLTGKKVYEHTWNIISAGSTVTLDNEILQSGTYTIRLQVGMQFYQSYFTKR